jgi:two-component system phosphate regulon response regulator OmpR
MVAGLREQGFDVATAPNAECALVLLAESTFDLAIVDLMLPRTNGMQLARVLRERHPRMRVVLTSTYPLSEPQLRRSDCGAIGFVPKLLDSHALAQFVEAKLDARPSRPHGVSLA